MHRKVNAVLGKVSAIVWIRSIRKIWMFLPHILPLTDQSCHLLIRDQVITAACRLVVIQDDIVPDDVVISCLEQIDAQVNIIIRNRQLLIHFPGFKKLLPRHQKAGSGHGETVKIQPVSPIIVSLAVRESHQDMGGT